MRALGLALAVAALGAGVAHAQADPDAGTTCDGGLCDTTNDSTCSFGASDPAGAALVALALLAARRRR